MPGVSAGGRPVFVASDGGGRADADKLVRLESRPQPPDETGEIRPLRAVEGVQLIHHQVAQHAATLWRHSGKSTGRVSSRSSIL